MLHPASRRHGPVRPDGAEAPLSAGPFGRRVAALPSCRLRPLAGGEAEPLARALAGLDPWRRLGFSAESLGAYLARRDPGLTRRAVVAGGEVVGAACVRYPWLRGPYLELLAVLPAHQGRGLGTEILAWMEGEALGRCGNAWVAVSAPNEGARRFYARRGYRELAELDGLVREGETELLLRKRL